MAQGRSLAAAYSYAPATGPTPAAPHNQHQHHPPTPASSADYLYPDQQPATAAAIPGYDYFPNQPASAYPGAQQQQQQPYAYQHPGAQQPYAQYDQQQQQYPAYQQLPPPHPIAGYPNAAAADLPNPLSLLAPSNQQESPFIYSHPQQPQPQHQQVMVSPDHPDWPTKYHELLRHYQDHVLTQLDMKPARAVLWRDYAVALAAKHPFLAFAICAFASLHLDFCRLQQQQGYSRLPAAQPFEPSELSMNLYNQALALCEAECGPTAPTLANNFEAAYFATSLIWMCSFRLTKTIPLYASPGFSGIDIFSLAKGPISILASVKAYLPHSPLKPEFDITHGSESSGAGSKLDDINISVKIVDYLQMLAQMLTADGELTQNPGQILEMIRNGPVSPPVEEPAIHPYMASGYQDPKDYPYNYGYTYGQSSSSFTPAAASSSGTPTTRKAAFIDALTSLRSSIRMTLTSGDFAHLFKWSMTLRPSFLALIRGDPHPHPFALVILAHYLAALLFGSRSTVFWEHERLISEIKLITGSAGHAHIMGQAPRVPQDWMAFLKWPQMVVQTVEAQQQQQRKGGQSQALGMEVMKQMIQYTL